MPETTGSALAEPITDDRTRLAELRARIDRIDRELVAALAERYRVVEEVGSVKGRFDIAVLDPAREAEIVRRAGRAARAERVPVEGVRQLFWVVLDYCREGARRRHHLARMLSSRPATHVG